MAAPPPPPPPPGYLPFLLRHDFTRRCRPDCYCFYCSRAICSHCCPGHRASHHPHIEGIHYPTVRILDGGPAVEYSGVAGCGYSFNGIDRIRHGQDTYLLLRRRPAPPVQNNPLRICARCGDATRRMCETCSVQCRLEHHPDQGGLRAREEATAMRDASAMFLQEFPQDRFCTGCRKLYQSEFCGVHAACHHTGRGDIIRLLHLDGRVLTRVDGALPPHVLAGVQVLDVGGHAMVQVIPTNLGLGDLVDGFSICLAADCDCAIGDGYSSCSMLCQARVNDWKELLPI